MTTFKRAKPKRSTENGTEEQVAIWDAIASQNNELVIDAKAGTGKTTTCIASMQRIAPVARITRKRIGFCAFTKSVGDELSARVPHGMQGGTLHSFMFQVLKENFPGLRIERKKTQQMQDELFKGQPWTIGERWALIRMVSLCKNEGIDRVTLENKTLYHNFVQRLNARHSFWSERRGPANLIPRCRKILEVSMDLEYLHHFGIDFDDMLWIPYIHGIFPKAPYDLLYVDEAQDINRIQQMNALCLSQRIIAIGDRNQAIFGFRGADTEALDNLKKILTLRHEYQPIELPLTTCWRCPLTGISLAQQLVPAIQPSPTAIDGEIAFLPPEKILAGAKGGDLILCRTNAPLIRAVYRLWKMKKPAKIVGRQFGDHLVTLVEQIESDSRCTSMEQFDLAVYEREEADIRRVLQLPDSEAEVRDIRERFDCLRAISENARSLEGMKSDLESLFSDDPDSIKEKPKIRLSSVHRAKGLEADNVSILEPHLMPHPRALQEWEQEQEVNICYVAITRHKKRLQFGGNLPSLLR